MVERGGTVKKLKMKVVEDDDACEESVENRVVGGHSTFEIRILCLLGY